MSGCASATFDHRITRPPGRSSAEPPAEKPERISCRALASEQFPSIPCATGSLPASVARVSEGLDGGQRIASNRARAPGLAAIAALPELPVGEAGEQAAVLRDECVGHRRQRFRETAREREPLTLVAAVDAGLWVATSVGRGRPAARGQVPELGVVRIDGHRPCVVAVATLIGRMPRRAPVFAPSCAATGCLIRPARDTRVPGERMDVALRARAMVLPG